MAHLGQQVDGLAARVAQHAARLAQQQLEGAEHLGRRAGLLREEARWRRDVHVRRAEQHSEQPLAHAAPASHDLEWHAQAHLPQVVQHRIDLRAGRAWSGLGLGLGLGLGSG